MTFTDDDLIVRTGPVYPGTGVPYRVERIDGATMHVWADDAAQARRIEREWRRRMIGELPTIHGTVRTTCRVDRFPDPRPTPAQVIPIRGAR